VADLTIRLSASVHLLEEEIKFSECKPYPARALGQPVLRRADLLHRRMKGCQQHIDDDRQPVVPAIEALAGPVTAKLREMAM
jgi:hypothetical protein